MKLSFLDIILLIPLIYGLVKGLFRGLIGELASIIGIVAAAFIAFKLSDIAFVHISPYFKDPGIETRALSFILVFVVVIILISLLSKAVTKALNALALGAFNHILGGAFGLLKWGFITLVAVYFFNAFQTDSHIVQASTLEGSIVYQKMVELSSNFNYYLDALSKI